MSKEHLKTSWRKLDNTAKIFSLDDIRRTNTFRCSVILKNHIDVGVLKQAVNRTLKYHPEFKVKIGVGFFWNYFEPNKKEPIIKKESDIPCQHIDFKKNNDYLFKVTYYKKKINIDFFHALTDGAGALQFLKSIIYNYLDLKNNLPFFENKTPKAIKYQDFYLKKYDKSLKEEKSFNEAYLLPKKINKNINNTYHYIININDIKKVCKNYKVTITEYLTATHIYAIYQTLYQKDQNKEIVITVPIDLRKYYQVETFSNFFVCTEINSKILEKNLTSFEEVLVEVHKDFQEKVQEDKIKKYLARDVRLGTNLPIRLVPLFIKKLFIKYAGSFITKSSTSTVSNVGIVNIEEKYQKYIDNILVLVLPGKFQKVKCTICSYNKKLNVTMNSNIDDIEFEQAFFKLLKKNIKNIKVKSNNYIHFVE